MIPTISLRTFLSPPKRNPLSISSPSHFSPASSAQAGRVGLFTLHSLHSPWPSCLSPFPEHRVFKVHPWWSTFQSFTPFNCQITLHCMDVPYFIYPFLS